MRCKNCGTENEEGRYICENCGSPLYDEDEIAAPIDDNSTTQTFKTPVAVSDDLPPAPPQNNTPDEKPEKKSVIVIAILAVVLVAIIVSIIVVAVNRKNTNEQNTSSSTSTTISTTASTSQYTTERTTHETTTQSTTQATTVQTWIINTSSSGGGSVSGGGEFDNGTNVTITATADSGFVFDGWYSNGIKVSSNASYSFIANENASFSAVFSREETQTQPSPQISTDINDQG